MPVVLGIGIGAYFGLPREPGPALWAAIASAAALAVLGAARWQAGRVPLLMLMLLLGGLLLAGARAHLVAEPKLAFRYYGPIEGRVIDIDRSHSDKIRLTLDRVALQNMPPDRTPARVRVSLHGSQGFVRPRPGLRVMTTGHLSPPQGPVEPGGFDFRRHAWFKGLGAVGYTRTPVLTAAPVAGEVELYLHRLRQRISTAVQAEMPGEPGAFAAAITTGDRAGIGRDTLEALRAANLAHLLAISGLHMGLLTAVVFAALRYGMATWPVLALRWPVKKIAALGALAAGAVYLGLSGGNVATERAFVMVAVMLVAVVLDRRALTLRAVALAAIIVLVRRPEALVEPGFQMSFSATTALVAVFGWLREIEAPILPRWLRPAAGVLVSSAVAGAATAPIAAAHFNQIAHYGLVANLLSVPLMGLVIMPGAVLAACLAPFGLGWVGLALMRPAISWILGVAELVAARDGALSHVVTPGPWVLPLLALGMLVLILWRGRPRLLGLVPAAAALALWAGAERPALLVSETGSLVGLLTSEGRALSKPRGEGFAALSWLENDGDPILQADAFARPGLAGDRGELWFQVGAERLVHLSGRGAAGKVSAGCAAASLVILSGETQAAPACRVVDRRSLRDSGAVAITPGPGGLRLRTAEQAAGDRLWTGRATTRARGD